jgi:hypothetical protein
LDLRKIMTLHYCLAPIPSDKRFINLTGRTFERLTIVGYAGSASWVCKCDCGTTKIVKSRPMVAGLSRSCGCLRSEQLIERNYSHGQSKRSENTQEYQSWQAMKARCYGVNSRAYKRYGERGIEVCDRWRDNFSLFYLDMGAKPTSKHTLERIDNDGNYEPGNVRWATYTEQANNRRSNRLLEFDGRIQNVEMWAKELELNSANIRNRLHNNWCVRCTLTIPYEQNVYKSSLHYQVCPHIKLQKIFKSS